MARLANEFSWSVSRDHVFRECRRAYYYTYYGAWGGWEAEAPERTRLLYRLKNIKSLAMWAGSVVHDTIAEALNRYTRTGQPPTAGELQARARTRLRSGWIESVNREWLARPKKTNLFELYYGNGTSLPAEMTDRTRKRVYDCLAAFAESAVLREILAVPYLDWKPVDSLDSFDLEGLKVWCAIDFAYTDPSGTLRIVDWKTGSERRESLSVQMACYALYAASAWFVPLEQVRTYGVFLGEDGRVSPCSTSPEVLVQTKDLVLSSAAAMRQLLRDVEANVAEEDSFPFCENEAACRRCNFREACPTIEGDGRNIPAARDGDER
ncbi:MAG: PD-(D/E)XK nuclease family protein [Lentisphaeria bacterium]|nr:PD-(D/E)XK nuclease family protein [Lentisphaeria bacterium]